MKRFTAISSLLVLGTLGLLMSSWLAPEEANLNLPDEDTHLYL